jgi:hypothetical protein
VSGPYGLVPFDLSSVAALIPGYHKRRGMLTRTAELGSHGDHATLEVTTWDGCAPDCYSTRKHKAGRTVILAVPCDSLPHCNACECGSEHRFYISDEQVAALKDILA